MLGADPPGSSAAGEQPKFAIHHVDVGHVIVKFSPTASSADARRWCDLLRAEHLAQVVIAEHGLPAARTAINVLERRVFLESQRFDRHGARGRSAALSLTMVDAEFAGRGHGWTQVAQTLRDSGLLDDPSLAQVRWLEVFGEWIGNTDMHLGNLSLAPTATGFRVLPVYDMLPMAFAPVHGGLPEVQLQPPIRTTDEEAWVSAGKAAAGYWLRLADDRQLSSRFRALAGDGRRWRELLGC